MKTIICIIVCCSMGLLSCGTGQSSVPESAITSDTIKKDIPAWRRTKSHQQLKTNIENLIGIQDLEKGFKDQQIRVWFTNSSYNEQLLIFKKVNNGWTGELNVLKFVYGLKAGAKSSSVFNDSLISIERNRKDIHPRSGWENFYDSLVRLDILSLPDMENIPEYVLGTDGRWVTIEIATVDSYRIYSYYELSEYANKFWQADRVEKIVKLIEEEFSFRSLVHPLRD